MSFRNILRAASLALVVASSSLVAAPAFAQSGGFNFGIQGSDGFGFSITDGTQDRRGNDWGNGRGRDRDRDREPSRRCLDSRGVRSLVQDYGYRDVRPYSDDRGTVRVQAERGRQSYIVTVDPCRARIVDEDRIRSRR